ncbi:hypothetical protein NDU88_005737 [Pleurodeles waltl]|uniref:Uncharacterized protein n=1 Tax=Pleurodeles waltl TaxID=8319 RepID=A0AAV7TW74_PLEWA|nr:hypothetical protein NDU88_005737 [Pleurodeles waltl]
MKSIPACHPCFHALRTDVTDLYAHLYNTRHSAVADKVQITDDLKDLVMEPEGCNPRMCLLVLVKDLQPANLRFVGVALLLAKRRVALQGLSDLAYCGELELYAEELLRSSRLKDIWGAVLLIRIRM